MEHFKILQLLLTGNRAKKSRAVLLMEPLAAHLGIPLDDKFQDKAQEEELIDHIFQRHSRGDCVLICWEHHTIPESLMPAIFKHIQRLAKSGGHGKPLPPTAAGASWKDFHSWNWDPSERKKDDGSLYSLIVVIDPFAKKWWTASQNFN